MPSPMSYRSAITQSSGVIPERLSSGNRAIPTTSRDERWVELDVPCRAVLCSLSKCSTVCRSRSETAGREMNHGSTWCRRRWKVIDSFLTEMPLFLQIHFTQTSFLSSSTCCRAVRSLMNNVNCEEYNGEPLCAGSGMSEWRLRLETGTARDRTQLHQSGHNSTVNHSGRQLVVVVDLQRSKTGKHVLQS